MSKSLTASQLTKALAKRFPKVWIKDGADFEASKKGTLWTGEGSYIEAKTPGDGTEQSAFSMYYYENGVAKELEDFLTASGWHAEAYNAGTFFLYRDYE